MSSTSSASSSSYKCASGGLMLMVNTSIMFLGKFSVDALTNDALIFSISFLEDANIGWCSYSGSTSE